MKNYTVPQLLIVPQAEGQVNLNFKNFYLFPLRVESPRLKFWLRGRQEIPFVVHCLTFWSLPGRSAKCWSVQGYKTIGEVDVTKVPFRFWTVAYVDSSCIELFMVQLFEFITLTAIIKDGWLLLV